jgi:phenylalanyl-tRNA synthetase beta subunit
LVRGADRLRRTLLPSLLEARAGNVAVGTADADLFEIARGYLARPAPADSAPSPAEEPLLLGCVAGGGFFRGKGLAEAVLARLGIDERSTVASVAYRPVDLDLFVSFRQACVAWGTGPGSVTEFFGPRARSSHAWQEATSTGSRFVAGYRAI